MAQEEVLGIRIKIDLGDFQASMDKITVALTAIGASAGKGAEAGVKATKSQLALLQAAWGGTVDEVKKKLADMYDIQQVQKFIKQDLDLKQAGLRTENAAMAKFHAEALADEKKFQDARRAIATQNRAMGLKESAAGIIDADRTRKKQVDYGSSVLGAERNTNAFYNKAGDSFMAVKRQQEQLAKEVQSSGKLVSAAYVDNAKRIQDAGKLEAAAHSDNNDRIQKFGKIVSAAYKDNADKIQKSGRLEVAAILENRRLRNEAYKEAGSQVMREFSRSGTQPVNGGWVNSSVNTKQSMDDAHASALKMNAALAGTTHQSNLLNISLKNMAARLVEFYSIRNVLFAVTTQLRDAVSGALDFNQKIHDIAAISGASNLEMRTIGDSILQIATNSRYTAAEVGILMEVLAQAGVAAKDLPTVSNTVGMFATGTGATPQQAAEIFTTAMNVWKISAEDSTSIANVLTAALNNSKLSVQGLGTAFSYLAPQAAQMGYTMEETAAMVATLSQVGIKSSTIGTGLSQLLKDLSAPKPRFEKMLSSYGITLDQVNPRLNKFVDIIALFNSKGLTAEDIMSKMDSRSGRSLVASMLAGADAMKTMTDSVTGTNASLLAYEKAMEGARAKMNVLKQEVLKTTVQAGGVISGVLAGLLTFATNAVRGLQTVEGSLMLVVGVLAVTRTAVGALTAACIANPVLAGVAVGIFVVTSALAYFGSRLDESTDKADKLSKALDASGEKTQKIADGFNKAKNEAGVLNPAIAEYNKLVAAGQGNSEKANALKDTAVTLNKDTKTSLYDLKDAFGDYFEGLDLEALKYSELLVVIEKVNKARHADSDTAAESYNELQLEQLADKAILEELKLQKAQSDKGIADGTGGNNPLAAASNYWRTRQVEKRIEDREPVLEANRSKIIKADWTRTGKGIYFPSVKSKVAETEEEKRVREMKEELAKDRSDANEAEKNAAKPTDTWLTDAAKISSDATARELGDRKKVLVSSFDDLTLTYQQKAEAYTQAVLIAEQESNKKTESQVLDLNKKWEAKKKAFGFSSTDRAAYEAALASVRREGAADLDKEVLGMSDSFDKGTKKEPTDDKSLTGQATEKQEAFRLLNLNKAIALRKEDAGTAQEVEALDIEALRNQEESLRNQSDAYEFDLNKLRLSTMQGTISDKDAAYLAGIPEKLQAIAVEGAEVSEAIARATDQGLWSNLVRGAKQGTVALGTIKSATIDLGQTMISTLANGIGSALDGMIDKIEQNKSGWVSFRDTMRGVLSDMGQMIQQYITRLMALWVIQQLTGMMGGGGKAPDLNSGGGNLTGKVGSVGNFSLIGKAEGGLLDASPGGFIPLNLGTRGKDSVPFIGMPGEFVIREDAVNAYGVDFFRKANAKQLADGGLVGGPAGAGKAAAGSKEGGGENTLTIINVVDPNSIPKTSGAEIINVISYEAAKNGPVFRQWKGLIKNG